MSLACPGSHLGGYLVDGQWIVAIDRQAGDAIACGALGDILDGQHIGGGAEEHPGIVLADKDDGQLFDGGKVQALVKGSPVGSTFAAKDGRDGSRPFQAGGQPGTGAQDPLGADDGISGDGIGLHVHQVHVAATAFHDTGALAIEFGPQTVQIAATGNIVP